VRLRTAPTEGTGRALIELAGVTCTYGGAPVLLDVDLDVATGELVGVVGPSGSGKTSLLRVLLGSLAPVAGTVRRRDGVRVAYVPQVETVSWSFPVTVAECVLMSRTRGRRLPWASVGEKRELDDVLWRLGIGDLADRHIRALSGGQQQRVFLARALFSHPDLLLLDEPTSGVDVATRHDVLHLLSELNTSGLSILLTTHDLNGIAAHLPRIVCVNRSVIASGAPTDVLRPDVLERTYGAPMQVLEHGGMPVVVDLYEAPR
jgi:ABC-type Mn2+/Zn2+ transport system ATPase subunit